VFYRLIFLVRSSIIALMRKRLENTKKNKHAQALGRLGGLKGGRARAATLAPEERSAIARKAVMIRWARVRAEEKAKEKTR
jgi:hypothetical protein